jgi:hypothetical protein
VTGRRTVHGVMVVSGREWRRRPVDLDGGEFHVGRGGNGNALGCSEGCILQMMTVYRCGGHETGSGGDEPTVKFQCVSVS